MTFPTEHPLKLMKMSTLMSVFGLVGFFLLSLCATGETRVMGSSPTNMISSPVNATILALLGDDVILPCRLATEVDIERVTVEWSKPGLRPDIVHLYRDGHEIHAEQNLAYAYRTILFIREDTGNVSLKLGRVNRSDEGNYQCFIPSLKNKPKAIIQLIVGAVSQPVASIVGCEGSGSMLQCDARGWYPKPVLEWLDDEGHVLPIESVNREQVDSNGLYNLMSHVKVTTTNRFTCRVRQPEINQTRVTEIRVPDNCMESCTLYVCIAILPGIVLALVLAVIIIKKWKDNTDTEKERKTSEDQKLLMKQPTDGMPCRFCGANAASEPPLQPQKTLLEEQKITIAKPKTNSSSLFLDPNAKPNANPSSPVLDPNVITNILQNKDLNPSNQTYSDAAKPSITIGEEDNLNIRFSDTSEDSTLPSSSGPTKHFKKNPKLTHQPNSYIRTRCASHSGPRIVPNASKLPRCASLSGSRPVLNAPTHSRSASQLISRLSFSTKNPYNALSDLNE